MRARILRWLFGVQANHIKRFDYNGNSTIIIELTGPRYSKTYLDNACHRLSNIFGCKVVLLYDAAVSTVLQS